MRRKEEKDEGTEESSAGQKQERRKETGRVNQPPGRGGVVEVHDVVDAMSSRRMLTLSEVPLAANRRRRLRNSPAEGSRARALWRERATRARSLPTPREGASLACFCGSLDKTTRLQVRALVIVRFSRLLFPCCPFQRIYRGLGRGSTRMRLCWPMLPYRVFCFLHAYGQERIKPLYRQKKRKAWASLLAPTRSRAILLSAPSPRTPTPGHIVSCRPPSPLPASPPPSPRPPRPFSTAAHLRFVVDLLAAASDPVAWTAAGGDDAAAGGCVFSLLSTAAAAVAGAASSSSSPPWPNSLTRV